MVIAGYDITVIADKPEMVEFIENLLKKNEAAIIEKQRIAARKLLLYGTTDIVIDNSEENTLRSKKWRTLTF